MLLLLFLDSYCLPHGLAHRSLAPRQDQELIQTQYFISLYFSLACRSAHNTPSVNTCMKLDVDFCDFMCWVARACHELWSQSSLLLLSLGLKYCALQKASVSKHLSKMNYPLSKGPEYGFSQDLLPCLIPHCNLLGSYCAFCNGG